jgi:hypothetical protein
MLHKTQCRIYFFFYQTIQLNLNKTSQNMLQIIKNPSYLGGFFSRKSWTCEKEGLNKDSPAAKDSSKGTEPLVALTKSETKSGTDTNTKSVEVVPMNVGHPT